MSRQTVQAGRQQIVRVHVQGIAQGHQGFQAGHPRPPLQMSQERGGNAHLLGKLLLGQPALTANRADPPAHILVIHGVSLPETLSSFILPDIDLF